MIIKIAERHWEKPGRRGTPRWILLNTKFIRTIRPSNDGLGSVIEIKDSDTPVECTASVEDLARLLEARVW